MSQDPKEYHEKLVENVAKEMKEYFNIILDDAWVKRMKADKVAFIEFIQNQEKIALKTMEAIFAGVRGGR